jgi:hypothetical protein
MTSIYPFNLFQNFFRGSSWSAPIDPKLRGKSGLILHQKMCPCDSKVKMSVAGELAAIVQCHACGWWIYSELDIRVLWGESCVAESRTE